MKRTLRVSIAIGAISALLLVVTACGGGASEGVDKDDLVDDVISIYYAGETPDRDCVRSALDDLSADDLAALRAAADRDGDTEPAGDPPQIDAITTACVGTELPVEEVPVDG